MNEIRRPDRTSDEIARIRTVVGRHPFPEFVTGFDVELGEFHEEPSMWIIFHTIGDRPISVDSRRARADRLRAFKDEVHLDLLAEIGTRYPYYRFSNSESTM